MKEETKITPLQSHENLDSMSKRVDYVRVMLEFPPNQLGRLIGSRTETVISICEGNTEPTIKFIKNMLSSLPVSEQFLFMGGSKDSAFTESIEKHKYDVKTGLAKNKEYSDEAYVSRFRYIRHGADLSQSQFAISIGVSRDVISAIENGRQTAPLYVIRALANKYNVNLHWLITGDGDTYLNMSEEDIKKREAIESLESQLKDLRSS